LNKTLPSILSSSTAHHTTNTSLFLTTGASERKTSISSVLGSLETPNSYHHSAHLNNGNKENSVVGDIMNKNSQEHFLFMPQQGSGENKNRLSSYLFMNGNSIDLPSPSCNNPPKSPFFKANLNSSCMSIQSSANADDLVEECKCFRIEVGGDVFRGLGLVQDVSQRRMMKMSSLSILDKISNQYKKDLVDSIEINNNEPFTIEYQDYGAYYYRYYFHNLEHANYLGIDKDIGPVAISIRRDKLIIEPLQTLHSTSSSSSSSSRSNSNSSERNYEHVYRFIMRTSDVRT
jgi:hypothetical protein